MRTRFRITALAIGLSLAGTSDAQPLSRAQQAAAMLSAAGFQIRGGQIVNACGRPAQPRPVPVDLNGDGRPEAIVADQDAACYGPTGAAFSVIQQQGPARWALVGAGRGRIKVLETRTNGWRDWSLEGPGCQRTWSYQPGQGYVSLKPCPGDAEAKTAAAPPSPATADDRAAAFKAAGFAPTRGRYLACDTRQTLEIEIRDLNGDGRPDAVITDSGLECYGSTEQGFVIVARDPGGAWRKLFNSPGIPTFLTTRGVGGWPDIENGGPGFCHPVMRWNGRDYATIRWRAEQPGACAGRR